MVQESQDFGFPLESRHSLSITGERLWQNLDGDIAPELRIAGTVHLTHPARTN